MLLTLLLACADPKSCETSGKCDVAGDPPAPDTAEDTDLPTDTDDSGEDTAPVEDADGDGSPAGEDCDDGNSGIYPGAPEGCDGLDSDCDGAVPARESQDDDADGDAACEDCDDLDAAMRESDGTCDAYRFPFGYMSVEDSGDLAELAARGITQVHAYSFGPWPGNDLEADISWSLSYLDEAEANGLTVLANLNGRTRAEQGASTSDFTAFVESVKGHPALGAWYLADEPEYSIAEANLVPMADVLEALTPDVPVQIAHCWCTGWWSFWYVADVSMPDFYGIMNEDAPSENTLYHPTLTSYMKGYYTEQRIDPVMQGFNYAVYSGDDPEAYPPDSRFPTREELRFWAFSDLTMGVGALWWWSWYRANEHADGPDWLEDTFYPHLAEMIAFTDAVKPASHPVSVNPGPQDILDYTYLAYWPRPEATYVVATNGSSSARALDIALGEAFADAALQPWDHSTPALTLDATGAGTVEADGYAVFIWAVPQ